MQKVALCFTAILSCFLAITSARTQDAPVIEGCVVNTATGRPISDARVKLVRGEAEPLYAKTDTEGRFRIDAAEQRGYALYAERPGFMQLPGPVYLTGRGESVRIELLPYAVISGKVTDPDGMPLSEWPVQVLRKRPETGGGRVLYNLALPGGDAVGYQAGVSTNDLGEFRVTQLEPGTYFVVADKRNGASGWDTTGYRVTYYPRTLDLASAKPLELVAGSEARADIQIVQRDGVRVSGRVIPAAAQDASVVRETMLTLVPQQDYIPSPSGVIATAEAGQFAFGDVLPGKYILLALTRESKLGDISGASGAPVLGLAREIEIGDRDMEGITVALQPLSDLPGSVSFAEGCAPAPVVIRARAFSQIATSAADAVSGSDGRFVLRGLQPARIMLSVSSTVMTSEPQFFPVSMRLGERDISEAGFDYPTAAGDTLRIVLDCAANRRPR